MAAKKCQHPGGVVVTFLGREVEPCRYIPIERHENVTVTVSRCRICGDEIVGWKRTPETVSYISKDGSSIE